MGATLVVGLAFGDEGKGATCDYLTRQHRSQLTVRFNGGAQAGHNVVCDDGRHHCFAQWGSGTFAGARTYLSPYMLVNPIAALSEAKHLESVGIQDPLSLLYVDRSAVVTTPFHVAANRLRELARAKTNSHHGSCGMGIGETMADVMEGKTPVRIEHLENPHVLRSRLGEIRARKVSETRDSVSLLDPNDPRVARELDMFTSEDVLDETMLAYEAFCSGTHTVDRSYLLAALRATHVVFEGAQGVLLDQNRGYLPPHVTWSDCTFSNALDLLSGSGSNVCRIGVTRTFFTRHGAGPFRTEGPPELQRVLASDDHNGYDAFQHDFRVGHLDGHLLLQAIGILGGLDGLSITHLDKFPISAEVCWDFASQYDRWTLEKDGPLENYLSRRLGVPLAVTSNGPKTSHRRASLWQSKASY
jgi:adenylosuccinate synthase